MNQLGASVIKSLKPSQVSKAAYCTEPLLYRLNMGLGHSDEERSTN